MCLLLLLISFHCDWSLQGLPDLAHNVPHLFWIKAMEQFIVHPYLEHDYLTTAIKIYAFFSFKWGFIKIFAGVRSFELHVLIKAEILIGSLGAFSFYTNLVLADKKGFLVVCLRDI
ncbi:hypothetical protein KFK09_020272 [Dendrobium nobile]|uniref:Uncharacterized protein n=1 Tax=Dendrobium nobile TaxID=94219 RepID=A0A8T3ASU8_DENNO|nr:hypothetical protein KFK09_020272 [Dendrobium nobile]